MQYISYLPLFILGTIIGSFLNVVIYRLNSGFGMGGRSQCFSCGKVLRWYELIPILSFLFLRGRCGVCRAKISFQYPVVEFITGMTFVLLFQKGSQVFMLAEIQEVTLLASLWFVLCATALATLIVIAVYDLKHKIIPNSLSIIFASTSLVFLILKSPLLFFYLSGLNIFSWQVITPFLIELSSGPVFFLFFFVFWFFSGGTWMGLGDAKLAIGIGWFLGWSAGVASLMLSFWIGALVSIGIIFLPKLLLHQKFFRLNSLPAGITIKSEVPFAPFLVISFFLVFFFDITLGGLQSFITTIFYL